MEIIHQQASDYSNTLTIASGGTTTSQGGNGGNGVFDARFFRDFGLVMPAAFTGTAITFQTCDTATGTFQPLYDTTNAQVSLSVAAGRNYQLPSALRAWRFFKLVSNAAEAGNRALTVVAVS